MFKKNCITCGVLFSTYNREQKLCSRTCRTNTNLKKEKVSKTCEYCGKDFLVHPYRQDTAKFCSRKCRNIDNLTGRVGELNANYKDGAFSYRRFLKEECERCGSTDSLIIHHVDENRRNNKPDNLETLCRSCHSKEHNIVANTKHNWGDKPRPRRAIL
jgi:5-methylcytosine-specific restriction endonuclease McrA